MYLKGGNQTAIAISSGITNRNFNYFSYTHRCYQSSGQISFVTSSSDAILGEGGVFTEQSDFNLVPDRKAEGITLTQATAFIGGTSPIENLDHIAAASKAVNYNQRDTVEAISDSENSLVIGFPLTFNSVAGFSFDGSTLTAGVLGDELPAVGTRFDSINSTSTIDVGEKTIRFNSLGGIYSNLLASSTIPAVSSNVTISNSTLQFVHGQTYFLENCDLSQATLVATGDSVNGDVILNLGGGVNLPDPLPSNFIIPLSGTITISKTTTDPHYAAIFTYDSATSVFTLLEETTENILSLNSSSHSEFVPNAELYLFIGGQYFQSTRLRLTVGANGLNEFVAIMSDTLVSREDFSGNSFLARIIEDTESASQADSNKFSSRENPVFIEFSGSSENTISESNTNQLIASLRETEIFAKASLQSFIDNQSEPVFFTAITETIVNLEYVTLNTFETNASGGLIQQRISGVDSLNTLGNPVRIIAGRQVDSSGNPTAEMIEVLAVDINFTRNLSPSIFRDITQSNNSTLVNLISQNQPDINTDELVATLTNASYVNNNTALVALIQALVFSDNNDELINRISMLNIGGGGTGNAPTVEEIASELERDGGLLQAIDAVKPDNKPTVNLQGEITLNGNQESNILTR